MQPYHRLTAEIVAETYEKDRRTRITSLYGGKTFRFTKLQDFDMDGVAYKDNKDEYIIYALKGSTTAKDWAGNVIQGVLSKGMVDTPEYNKARDNINRIYELYPNHKLIIAGHSRSGNTATALHLENKIDYPIEQRRVINFNPMSQFERYRPSAETQDKEYSLIRSRVTNYILNNDFASNPKELNVPILQQTAKLFYGVRGVDKRGGLRGITYRIVTDEGKEWETSILPMENINFQTRNHKIENFFKKKD